MKLMKMLVIASRGDHADESDHDGVEEEHDDDDCGGNDDEGVQHNHHHHNHHLPNIIFIIVKGIP